LVLSNESCSQNYVFGVKAAKIVYNDQMNIKLHILLLDGHTVQAISVIKALKKSDVYLVLFCEKKISFGFASRYPDKKVKCPSINNSSNDYYIFLLTFLKQNSIDLIIPLFDDSADLVNKYREEIESIGIRIGLPPSYQFNLARNKGLLMEFCHKNNIPHPITCAVNESNYEFAAKLVGFPSLLKPNKSSGAIGIIYLNSINQLVEYFTNSRNKQIEFSLQSFVNHSGYYYNSMLYRNRKGIFSKVVIVKILRYFPVKGGTGSYNETVDYPEIEEISKEILNQLNWVGFADLDFIVDKYTSKPKLVEINPRIPACIHSALVSGVNFPEIIVHDLLGKEMPNQNYISGKKVRYFAMDVLWFIFCQERFKVKPSWFRFFENNLFYQDGCWKDPLTMIAGIFMGVRKYLNKEYRKSKIN
jgi:D-aspartate ligase